MRISRELRNVIHYLIPLFVMLWSFFIIYFGWIKDINIVRSALPGHIEMRPSSAVMMVMISFMMLGFAHFRKFWAKYLCLFSSVAILMVVYTLIFVRYPDVAWNIERLLGYNYFVKTVLDPQYAPSVATMANSTLLSISGLCSLVNQKSRIIRAFGAFVGFSGLLGVIGHLLDIRMLYSYSHISQGMAFNTCLLYMLSGFNIWLLHKAYSQSEI